MATVADLLNGKKPDLPPGEPLGFAKVASQPHQQGKSLSYQPCIPA
jgi:hypothetical protein